MFQTGIRMGIVIATDHVLWTWIVTDIIDVTVLSARFREVVE